MVIILVAVRERSSATRKKNASIVIVCRFSPHHPHVAAANGSQSSHRIRSERVVSDCETCQREKRAVRTQRMVRVDLVKLMLRPGLMRRETGFNRSDDCGVS